MRQNANPKRKLLAGVLVVCVLLLLGWWWSSGGQKRILVCGPHAMGPNYDTVYCDRACNTDGDCRFTCGCGAISKTEVCHDEGIIYDCVNRYVSCESGKCATGQQNPAGFG